MCGVLQRGLERERAHTKRERERKIKVGGEQERQRDREREVRKIGCERVGESSIYSMKFARKYMRQRHMLGRKDDRDEKTKP